MIRLRGGSVTSLLVVLVCCGQSHDPQVGSAESAITSSCSGPPPKVGVCELAVCTGGSWDVILKTPGSVCNGTGTCDSAGTCVPPPPPPSCDHPPPPRYAAFANSNYPNGADILTCTRPEPGVEQWHIEYPSIDRESTEYPVITFNAFDSVTVSATGCAQTGGTGFETWKRYVNPEESDGRESDKYYGTVYIDGATGIGDPAHPALQPLQHWIGPAFVTGGAISSYPNLGHLVLGYTDNNYADNGYWGHDDGNLGQCASSNKATVDVRVDHRPRSALTCAQWNSSYATPVAANVPELAQIASLLRTQAEVPLGLPVTPDTAAAGIAHFQVFQDGQPGQTTTISNRPLNSAELHADGCIYTAYTPVTAPAWYPADLAFDAYPNTGMVLRPWDPGVGVLPPPPSLSYLMTANRDPSHWLSTSVPGTCAGSGASWRSSAPRWIKTCPPPLPPAQWTPTNILGFPGTVPESSKISHSGAMCGWSTVGEPWDSDDCTDLTHTEWTWMTAAAGGFVTAEGVVTNSFLSGGDYGGSHNDMPSDHVTGIHSDPLTHTDGDNCGAFTVDEGEHCADWELDLLVDANHRDLLARDESQLNDRNGGDCQAKHGDLYRKGNEKADLRGALGIEGEQWYYPFGFRAEPGDRAVVRGAWIVDCGHSSWHGELHPASLVESSYLQDNDYSPVAGATWNRPLGLTNTWRARTGGAPATITKIILSPVFAESEIAVDIWPPARPCAGARLVTAKEDPTPNPAWSGINILSEFALPADNPNHLHVTFFRPGGARNLFVNRLGEVSNPDPALTFFTAYMAWWDTSGVACPAVGGPGSGVCVPNQGAACGSCGGVVDCNGSCTVPTPINLNASCGADGGYVQCDSSCSVPAYGDTSSGVDQDANIDLNGDGKADVCGRASTGLFCALSTGTSFGPVANWGANFFTDSGGWGAPPYYSNIRYPDLDGDGKADVCGRGVAGF
ncbi:MAG: VCBS repeat-containing protein, partial [Kofleriaceae bacterium]